VTVSLALIVRNEEATLPRLLDSVEGAVDEVVVVDTGSSDRTLRIARRRAQRVTRIAWPEDFSAARQAAFDVATGDWVCWLDADDVVHGAAAIRELATTAEPGVDGFQWPYVVARNAGGGVTCEFWRERLVRNDGTFRWEGRIHETLNPTRPARLDRSRAVVVEHLSPPERAEAKSRRNLALLERELAEAGDQPKARILFYLGREHDGLGHEVAALASFERCAEVSTWDEERYMTQLHMADLHRRAGHNDQAVDADLRALAICPHWPNAYFSLAETYYFLGDWHKVIHWIDVGRAMPEPDSLQIMDTSAYRSRWLIHYTNALFHVGAVDEARAWTVRALNRLPDDPQHLANLRFFASVPGGAA
jgi:glycosyltransferase involved in cell wall biosynthesis